MSIFNDLTRQERIVLALVTEGKRNAEIARELYVSVRTVECHLRNIFHKLSVSSRTEAAMLALQTGFPAKAKLSGTAEDAKDSRAYY